MGYAIAVKSDKSLCYIDKSGNIVLDGLTYASTFYKEMAFIAAPEKVPSGTIYPIYLIDHNFNRLRSGGPISHLIGAIFAGHTNWEEHGFSEDMSLIRAPGSFREILVDYKGNIIADKVNISTNFYDGRARALAPTDDRFRDTFGYINKQGEFIFIFKDTEF